MVEAPFDLTDTQDEMLRQSAVREARLRDALAHIARGGCRSITDAEEVAQAAIAQEAP